MYKGIGCHCFLLLHALRTGLRTLNSLTHIELWSVVYDRYILHVWWIDYTCKYVVSEQVGTISSQVVYQQSLTLSYLLYTKGVSFKADKVYHQ